MSPGLFDPQSRGRTGRGGGPGATPNLRRAHRGLRAGCRVRRAPQGNQTVTSARLWPLVLTGHTAGAPAEQTGRAPLSIAALTAAVNNARRHYQACRYSDLVLQQMPGLITHLSAACRTLDGDDRLRAYTLSADAHHLLLGCSSSSMTRAWLTLAGDRSMRAAQREPRSSHNRSQRPDHHAHLDGRRPPRGGGRDGGQPGRPGSTTTSRPTHPNHCRSTVRSCSAARSPPPRTTTADTAGELLAEAGTDAGQRLGVDGNLPLDSVRADQRQAAPGQHRRHAWRRRDRHRRRPRHRPRLHHRHRAEGEPAHRHRPRLPSVGQAREGIHCPPRRRTDRTRGSHRPPFGTPSRPRTGHYGPAYRSPRRRAIRPPPRVAR